ncbi:MAG: acyltransferase domain-containing protein [Victivallaceae bacterium]
MNIEEIAVKLAITEENAEKLFADWDESEKTFPGVIGMPFLQDIFIRKYAKLGGLTDDEITQVVALKIKFSNDNFAARLLWHCYRMIYCLPGGREKINLMPELDQLLPKTYGVFFLLLVLAGYPDAVKFYQKHQLPENVMEDTLSDLSVWVTQYSSELNITGITRRILGWMQGHIRGELFRLGRLQFQNKFHIHDDIHVFRNVKSGRVKMLSGCGIRYNANGLIDGIGDVWDETGHWISEYTEIRNVASGNPISAEGYASPKKIQLELNEWRKALKKNSPALNIHIPAIGPMTIEMCADSISQAYKFFRKYFPKDEFKAFFCESWLLDNQFEQILRPDSNLLLFQHAGYLFPFSGESEAIYRVFGPEAQKNGIDTVPHTTGMQRAIAEFIHNGGILRNGGMFLLKEDLPWRYDCYRSQAQTEQ